MDFLKKPNSWGIVKLITFIIIVAMFTISEYKDYHDYRGSGMTKAEYEQVQRQQEMEDAKKLPEFTNSFNTVMSNTIGPIYSGCRIDSFDLATVYIKPTWYTLTEEQRTVIIDRVIKVYSGMIGARNIKSMQNQHVYMYFVDPVSEKQVGKWDYISGSSVSK